MRGAAVEGVAPLCSSRSSPSAPGVAMDQQAPTLTRLNLFERHLTMWVGLCIIGGILLGKISPGVAKALDGMAVNVGGAPVVSIPIAVCLFFMMYPIMVKIDFASVIKAGRSGRPVLLTLFLNWCIKPFTMYAIALLFLGLLFRRFIGVDAVDLVKMPFGLDLPPGAEYGAGKVVIENGMRMLQVPLWRSYLAGCILLGIAPCTAMVLVWGYLARGDDGGWRDKRALSSRVRRARGRASSGRRRRARAPSSTGTARRIGTRRRDRGPGPSRVYRRRGCRHRSAAGSPRSC